MTRRKPYQVMALVQVEVLRNPSSSVHKISRKLGVKWMSVNDALKALDEVGLYHYARVRTKRSDATYKQKKPLKGTRMVKK